MIRLLSSHQGRLRRPLPILILLLGLAPTLHAQTGRIAGTITDASDGTPVGTVTVEVGSLRAATLADGRFEIPGVPAGLVTVEARRVGYAPALRSVTVRAGETVRLDLALTPTGFGEAVIEGRATDLVGSAGAASEGHVGQDQIAPRPILRTGEVLETVPGLIVTQHSGSGKANQFFLRGFNLDHGTDFSASLEGVPFNLPTHAHGQGWLDLNSLIPELIDQIAFAKGPYDVRTGDFSTAGSARIRLVRRLDRGIARADGGTDEYGRVLLAQSTPLGRGDALGALNVQYTNGPWDSPENSLLLSGVAKYSTGTDRAGASVTAMGYLNEWNSTDQVALRAVDTGLISRLGALDPSDGGRTSRLTLVGQITRATPGSSQTQASAYAAYYDLNLFSNFTYFLDDPVRGDQFEQADRRAYGGANASQTWFNALGRGGSNTLGVDLRHDQIFQVGLFNTDERVRFNTVRDDEVGESSAGVYAENSTRWTNWFRTTAGLRADVYRFDVKSDVAANSGVATDALVSPRLSVAVGPWRGTEGYLNLGTGFHSNDARGTTITVDPAAGTPVDRADPLVRTRGAEVGARTTALPGLQSTLALWTIALTSELVFVGDAGGTEASDATRHTGVEFNNYYAAADWLNLNLDVALTRSRYTEGEDTFIENSIGRIVTGGVYAGRATGPLASLQLRHFGPRPLTGDGAVTSGATTLVNVKAGYRFRDVALALDVLNLLDSHAADVSYYYPSRLPGEAAEGVEDLHVHPVVPVTARLTAVYRF
ncbi:MAG TPA: TonB-dependent receptor [Rubricoccaceae bacterium]